MSYDPASLITALVTAKPRLSPKDQAAAERIISNAGKGRFLIGWEADAVAILDRFQAEVMARLTGSTS